MLKIIFVGLGGFAGSVSRYLLAGWIQKLLDKPYPYGTFTVNILGCLLIGLLAGLSQGKHYISPETRLLILVGFLGGFTTFSTFSSETFALLADGQMLTASINIAASIVFGLIAVWLGYTISNLI